MNFKTAYAADMQRYGTGTPSRNTRKFHYYFRKAQTTDNRLLKLYYRFRFGKIKEKYGIELSHCARIGQGLYVGHPYNITINSKAILGNNINIHKGVTIGQENRGKRKGVPTIGNRVWIGINAVIVGNINIGNDVLIAPNSYVNCDVPDHSVVFGNPCVIRHRENATEHYINNVVQEGELQ